MSPWLLRERNKCGLQRDNPEMGKGIDSYWAGARGPEKFLLFPEVTLFWGVFAVSECAYECARDMW